MADASFDLKDADGKVHTYELDYHPGQAGFALSADILKLGLPALLAMFEGDAEEADLASMGKALERADLVSLADRILVHTRRDGLALMAGVNFDSAYKANFAEAWQAVWEVARANRFLPELATLAKTEPEAEAA